MIEEITWITDGSVPPPELHCSKLLIQYPTEPCPITAIYELGRWGWTPRTACRHQPTAWARWPVGPKTKGGQAV